MELSKAKASGVVHYACQRGGNSLLHSRLYCIHYRGLCNSLYHSDREKLAGANFSAWEVGKRWDRKTVSQSADTWRDFLLACVIPNVNLPTSYCLVVRLSRNSTLFFVSGNTSSTRANHITLTSRHRTTFRPKLFRPPDLSRRSQVTLRQCNLLIQQTMMNTPFVSTFFFIIFCC